MIVGETAMDTTIRGLRPVRFSVQPSAKNAGETLEAEDGPIEAAVSDEAVGEPEAAEDDESPEQKTVDLGILEALLFATHHPLTGQRLAELLEIKSQKAIRKAVLELNQQYEE